MHRHAFGDRATPGPAGGILSAPQDWSHSREADRFVAYSRPCHAGGEDAACIHFVLGGNISSPLVCSGVSKCKDVEQVTAVCIHYSLQYSASINRAVVAA